MRRLVDDPVEAGLMKVEEYGAGKASALKHWEVMFPQQSPKEIYRRFSEAAGSEQNVRIEIKPVLHHSRSQPTEMSDMHIKIYHNANFGSLDNYVEFRMNDSRVHIENAKFDPENMGKGIAKRYVAEIAALAQERGCKEVTLQAMKEVGAYAWAKFGFKPESREEWRKLTKVIEKKLVAEDGNYAVNYLGSSRSISKHEYDAIKVILAEKEPEAIWHLLELKTPLGKVGGHEITTAKALLLAKQWDGKLSLDARSEGWQRFSEYVQPARGAALGIGA